jgi:predicted TPR repeat methyltransferase
MMATLRAAGFDPVTLEAGSTRKEAGVPVPGLIAVALRSAA